MPSSETLNSKQKEAVEATEGPVLVIAGAGAGKTRVITERIKYLIENGVPPESILAVTFTNKAAGEMRERIMKHETRSTEHMLHASGYTLHNLPFIGTFHALGLLIIRENLEKIGAKNNFTILDEDDSLKLIKECEMELKIDPKEFDPSRIRNNISRLKNQLISVEKFLEGSFFERQVGKVWRLYEEKTKKQNLLDFDDLLLRPTALLLGSREILKKYQERWRYIHIDEYQDTNDVQYALSKLLAAAHHNILAVGDIDQAIYSWRGADFRNVLNFQKDYPDAKVVTLEENYRSIAAVLEAANALILHNKWRIPKNLWTSREGDRLIRVIYAENDRKEAATVAAEILSLRRDRISAGEIAVLYRTNAQSRALEEALLARGIPYKITGGVRFYERREIKDLIAYLRLIKNPADELSHKRIFNVPPRKKKGINFDELMESFRREADKTAHSLLNKIVKKIGYRDYIDDGTEKGMERWQNVEELLGLAIEIGDIEKFLEHVSLFAADDLPDRQTGKYEPSDPPAGGRVNLMTAHAAKGLEFEAVFVVGLEEGLFPHMFAVEAEGIEEERRLCYVALTRAKNHLYLTCSARRALFGERTSGAPSRFLREIPEHLLVIHRHEYRELDTNDANEEIIIE